MIKHHVSFKHALDGLLYCFKTQPNYRFHLLAATLVTLLGLYLKLPSTSWILLVFTYTLVITAEMLNTAIESMTDLITLEHNVHAKIAKDVSAGMVLFSAFGAAIVGLFVFLPYLLNLNY